MPNDNETKTDRLDDPTSENDPNETERERIDSLLHASSLAHAEATSEQDPPVDSTKALMDELLARLDGEAQKWFERKEASELLWRYAFLKANQRDGLTPKALATAMENVSEEELANFKLLSQKNEADQIH